MRDDNHELDWSHIPPDIRGLCLADILLNSDLVTDEVRKLRPSLIAKMDAALAEADGDRQAAFQTIYG